MIVINDHSRIMATRKERANDKLVCDKKKSKPRKKSLIPVFSNPLFAMKQVFNRENFSRLSEERQKQLSLLLPQIDVSKGDSLRLKQTAFNNEYFNHALEHFKDRVMRGELLSSGDCKPLKLPKSRLDPWKAANMEQFWGEKFGRASCDASQTSDSISQSFIGATISAEAQPSTSIAPNNEDQNGKIKQNFSPKSTFPAPTRWSQRRRRPPDALFDSSWIPSAARRLSGLDSVVPVSKRSQGPKVVLPQMRSPAADTSKAPANSSSMREVDEKSLNQSIARSVCSIVHPTVSNHLSPRTGGPRGRPRGGGPLLGKMTLKRGRVMKRAEKRAAPWLKSPESVGNNATVPESDGDEPSKKSIKLKIIRTSSKNFTSLTAADAEEADKPCEGASLPQHSTGQSSGAVDQNVGNEPKCINDLTETDRSSSVPDGTACSPLRSVAVEANASNYTGRFPASVSACCEEDIKAECSFVRKAESASPPVITLPAKCTASVKRAVGVISPRRNSSRVGTVKRKREAQGVSVHDTRVPDSRTTADTRKLQRRQTPDSDGGEFDHPPVLERMLVTQDRPNSVDSLGCKPLKMRRSSEDTVVRLRAALPGAPDSAEYEVYSPNAEIENEEAVISPKPVEVHTCANSEPVILSRLSDHSSTSETVKSLVQELLTDPVVCSRSPSQSPNSDAEIVEEVLVELLASLPDVAQPDRDHYVATEKEHKNSRRSGNAGLKSECRLGDISFCAEIVADVETPITRDEAGSSCYGTISGRSDLSQLESTVRPSSEPPDLSVRHSKLNLFRKSSAPPQPKTRKLPSPHLFGVSEELPRIPSVPLASPLCRDTPSPSEPLIAVSLAIGDEGRMQNSHHRPMDKDSRSLPDCNQGTRAAVKKTDIHESHSLRLCLPRVGSAPPGSSSGTTKKREASHTSHSEPAPTNSADACESVFRDKTKPFSILIEKLTLEMERSASASISTATCESGSCINVARASSES